MLFLFFSFFSLLLSPTVQSDNVLAVYCLRANTFELLQKASPTISLSRNSIWLTCHELSLSLLSPPPLPLLCPPQQLSIAFYPLSPPLLLDDEIAIYCPCENCTFYLFQQASPTITLSEEVHITCHDIGLSIIRDQPSTVVKQKRLDSFLLFVLLQLLHDLSPPVLRPAFVSVLEKMTILKK